MEVLEVLTQISWCFQEVELGSIGNEWVKCVYTAKTFSPNTSKKLTVTVNHWFLTDFWRMR